MTDRRAVILAALLGLLAGPFARHTINPATAMQVARAAQDVADAVLILADAQPAERIEDLARRLYPTGELP